MSTAVTSWTTSVLTTKSLPAAGASTHTGSDTVRITVVPAWEAAAIVGGVASAAVGDRAPEPPAAPVGGAAALGNAGAGPHAVPAAPVSPAGQSVQLGAPAGRCVSGGQRSQCSREGSGTRCSGHSRHAPSSLIDAAPQRGAGTVTANAASVVRPRASVAPASMA